MDANGRPSPLSRWLTAGFTVAFAVSVAAVLFAREIGGGLSVEPRVAAGLSLAAYGGLALRGLHGLAVDRGRLLREAVSLALAEFEEHGAESALVRRLSEG